MPPIVAAVLLSVFVTLCLTVYALVHELNHAQSSEPPLPDIRQYAKQLGLRLPSWKPAPDTAPPPVFKMHLPPPPPGLVPPPPPTVPSPESLILTDDPS